MLCIKRQRRADLYLDIIEGFLNVAIGFLQHLDDCYDRKNMKILLAPKFCPPAHGEGNTSGQGWNIALSIKRQLGFGVVWPAITTRYGQIKKLPP